MPQDHPFQHLFETLGRVPAASAESVNRQAFEVLSEILSVPLEKTGRCILLRAPRAGHGKTHLLSRIQHQLGASCEFIPLHASFGCRIDAASVIDDILRRLVRPLPASGGLTALDLVTRRLFASALQPLVASGEVPCQDRQGALTALRARPVETFDFHHPNAATAHWARENFEVLGQRLSLELAQRAGLPASEVALWVEALFRFSAAPLENPNRVNALAESVHGGTETSMPRLEALLGLVTSLTRVVLVADDLEGFSTDDTSALKFAAFLGALRQSVERLDVILSLNQDIWQSAFVPRLSDGLADRLSEVVVELEPLTETEMADLLDSRVPGLGARVLEKIDVSSAGKHARGLMRAAGLAWLKATAMDSAPAAVAKPPSAPVAEISEPVSETPAFTYSHDVVAAVEDRPPQWPSPEFTPAPPSDPPTRDDTQGFTLEPPATVFAPAVQQEIAAPAIQVPHDSLAAEDSPFQMAAPENPAFPVTPTGGQPPPPFLPPAHFEAQEFASSPFAGEPAQTLQQEPTPIFNLPDNPPDKPAEVPPPPTAADTDRVENLLRQFRERYGRGSL